MGFLMKLWQYASNKPSVLVLKEDLDYEGDKATYLHVAG